MSSQNMGLWAAFYLITVETGLRVGDVRAHALRATKDVMLSWALSPLSSRTEHPFLAFYFIPSAENNGLFDL